MRPGVLIICATACVLAVAGCDQFPELEVSEARFDAKTPYPEMAPLEIVLAEPEPAITAEVEQELTQREADLKAAPDADAQRAAQQASDSAEAAAEGKPPLQDRLDALRKKRAAQAEGDPIFDDETRKRLEGGITPPKVPEG